MIDLRSLVTLGSHDGELGALTDRELSPLFRVLLRARLIVTPLMLIIAGLLWVFDPQGWKIALALTGAVILGVLGIRDRVHFHSPRLPPRLATELLGSVLTAHAILITLTGGIHSPFVIIPPVLILLAAIAVGRIRLVATVAGAVVLLAWVLAADDFIGPRPRLVPENFAEALPRLGGPAFAITMATVLTVASVASVTVGLAVRRAVERAIRTAAEARTETLATLRERNQELWTLSGAIAHELKNPLASVRGLGSLLARKAEAGTKEAERMAVMLDEVERMGSIIDEFLNFSRPLTEMTQRDVALRSLVDKVIALHRPLAGSGGVRLEGHVEGVDTIASDPRKLMQVLINLMHNAIDASHAGGTVRVEVRPEGDAVCFEVLDEGAGLDPQIRERLFTPGATTKPAGSGIGLTVARAIAEQHGGTLELEDRPRGGCRAVLRLPRSAGEDPASPPHPDRDEAVEAARL